MAKSPISPEREKHWASTLNLMINAFFQGKFLLPLIQKTFNDNAVQIACLYPQPPKFNFCRQSPPGLSSENVAPMACRLDGQELSLWFFFPDLELMEQRIRKEKHGTHEMDWAIRNALVIKLLHELDHMALQVIGTRVTDIVDGERRVWARTCQNTITPLVETYQQPLSFSDNLFYKNWLACGRDAESQHWRDFIKKAYGNIRK